MGSRDGTQVLGLGTLAITVLKVLVIRENLQFAKNPATPPNVYLAHPDHSGS